jgi:pimeloyl-ACP methyl ester carboxylesterase
MKPWTDRFVTVGDVRAHYLEAGQGEPLLLIHGGGMSSSAELNYGVVMEPLARHLRVIAVDVVGFGETEGADERHFAASAQGDFLIRFMEALDLRAHVGGNSHGGWLAQYVAHEAPERVRKLVIINSLNGTSAIPPAPEGLRYILGPQGHAHEAPTLENVRRGLERLFVDQRLVTDERVRRTLEIAERNHAYARARAEARQGTIDLANDDLAYRGQHISAFADRLPMDVLLTWSRENNGSTPADAVRFLERLRKAELHVFVDAGHHVMTEHPERWSDVVTSFLLAS